ncbi:MAG: metallophosphoesterase [Bacillota bacterium]|nr:metallophosphoesterase [Bacillota bacterium]
MAIYALSDFHLYLSMKDKPMDIFGNEWDNHMEKLRLGCQSLKESDVLLIPGDISWAMYLDEAFEDLKFIEEIPCKKIISKGNHDYWWTSHKKLKEYLDKCGFATISFLHNNFFAYGDIALCGNKGYFYTGLENTHDRQLYERELIRMELSLKEAELLGYKRKVFQTHYPPSVDGINPDARISEILKKYGVEKCVYGHIHGRTQKNHFEGNFEGIEYIFVSCEYLGFKPKLVLKQQEEELWTEEKK